MEKTKQNIDQQELAKFEKMAASWWDPNGDFKPIHRLNPVRLNYILQQSNGLFGKNVLDVGCGGGILTEAMAMQGTKVMGIDMSSAPLAVARQHAEQQALNIDYQQITIEELAQQQKEGKLDKFDVITCLEMLEHVPDPSSIIQSCRSLLKPDGIIFFSTINRTIKAWALVVVGAEYVLKMLPKGTHDYKKFIKPAELIHWAEQEALTCVDIKGYHYNPLTEKFWLNQDVSANYIATFKSLV